MSKHTPGPWHLETVKTSVGVCHKVGPFPPSRTGEKPRHACLYADYPSEHRPSDIELFANARLISAAPDLLAALESALPYVQRVSGSAPTQPHNTKKRDDAVKVARTIEAAIAKAKGTP